ncbi:hypothetical protein, partial [Aquibacillus kalidii]|uniref:hypothetical protein n=1 Tax=Aquibacillus kalidii TaxID=2762597 RepID=UPI001C99B3E6
YFEKKGNNCTNQSQSLRYFEKKGNNCTNQSQSLRYFEKKGNNCTNQPQLLLRYFEKKGTYLSILKEVNHHQPLVSGGESRVLERRS